MSGRRIYLAGSHLHDEQHETYAKQLLLTSISSEEQANNYTFHTTYTSFHPWQVSIIPLRILDNKLKQKMFSVKYVTLFHNSFNMCSKLYICRHSFHIGLNFETCTSVRFPQNSFLISAVSSYLLTRYSNFNHFTSFQFSLEVRFEDHITLTSFVYWFLSPLNFDIHYKCTIVHRVIESNTK